MRQSKVPDSPVEERLFHPVEDCVELGQLNVNIAINIGRLKIHVERDSGFTNQYWRRLIGSESLQMGNETLEVVRVVGG